MRLPGLTSIKVFAACAVFACSLFVTASPALAIRDGDPCSAEGMVVVEGGKFYECRRNLGFGPEFVWRVVPQPRVETKANDVHYIHDYPEGTVEETSVYGEVRVTVHRFVFDDVVTIAWGDGSAVDVPIPAGDGEYVFDIAHDYTNAWSATYAVTASGPRLEAAQTTVSAYATQYSSC